MGVKSKRSMPKLPSEKSRAADFGRTLRRMREKKNISLRRAAKLMSVSPALLSKAERGLADFRKPGHVSRAAGALDADVNELRRLAGLESLDLVDVWQQIASLGSDLIGARLKDPRDQRISRLFGYILLMAGFAAAESKEPGEKASRSEAELEEIFRLVVLVANRRHDGTWAGWAKPRDEGTKALHAAVDTTLDQLYKVHADDIEKLLKTE
jgi:transcriptional regulator with XRE-family HTH domain